MLKTILAPRNADQNIRLPIFSRSRRMDAKSCGARIIVVWTLIFGIAAPALAQPSDFEALNRKVDRLLQTRNYAAALPLVQRSVSSAETMFGPDDLRTASALSNLAGIYYAQDRYSEAEPLEKRVIAIREKAYSPNDPALLGDLNNLIAIEEFLYRFAEIDPLYRRVIAIQESVLGPNHPDVALTLNKLALFFRGQAQPAEAEGLLKRALAIDERAFGPDHPNTAQLAENLGQLYLHAGRYRESEQQLLRALEARKKSAKPEDPAISQSYNDLALLYDIMDRYAESEASFKRAIAIDEKLTPSTVEIPLNSLGDLYRKQGRFSDAEPLLKRALAIVEKKYGAVSMGVVAPSLNMAILYRDQGRYAEAESLIKRCISNEQAYLGPTHVDIAVAMTILADIYRKQDRRGEAEHLLKQTLEVRERVLGSNAPQVASSLASLADLYMSGSRFAEAEPLVRRSLAIREELFGPHHPSIAGLLAELARIYQYQQRYDEAMALVRRMMANDTLTSLPAIPILLEAQGHQLLSFDEAFDSSLQVAQRTSNSAAANALNALAIRFSAGNDRLSQLVRRDQDLADEDAAIEKSTISAMGADPSKRDKSTERKLRARSELTAKERAETQRVLSQEFPSYQALSRPRPLSRHQIQALLADDEVLIILQFGTRSFVWTLTKNKADWKEIAVSADQVSKTVSELRSQLMIDRGKPFDPKLSFELYQQILAPMEEMLGSRSRLTIVANGALTSLPPQVLVTRDPAGKALRDADWLIKSHAVTLLPSVASLSVLRSEVPQAGADRPMIGFADPIFNAGLMRPNIGNIAVSVTAARGLSGTVADIKELKAALPQLPETADELRRVGTSVKAFPSDLYLGTNATETRVKQTRLGDYRIVYFATHALLAGEVAQYAKLKAEPALVLSLPDQPTELDDGLLTASEIAQLKLNAEWVVLSACNTAAGDKPGAEALSGLARAFFYAGSRSLLVSNWDVETNSAVELMTRMFAATAIDGHLSHGEALRISMLAMIGNGEHPEWEDPKYWAPFVVVGEPAKTRK